MSRPADLPDFEHPPVTEVVLGVQFGTLPFRTLHAGVLAERFPLLTDRSEQMPLTPTFELFGGNPQVQFMQAMEFGISMVPRYWFRSPDGSHLVQIQADRVLTNWSRQSLDDVYPRYERVRERFIADFGVVHDFFKAQGIGEIRANQAEVTYVNTIALADKSNPQNQLSRIFKMWSKDYHDDQGREEEDANLNFRYLLFGQDDKTPIGRLYAAIQPASLTVDQSKVVQFKLTVRGKPSGESLDEVLKFCDFGREVIVRAFASMTRQEMHDQWGRKHVR